jgi:hypothetical protein
MWKTIFAIFALPSMAFAVPPRTSSAPSTSSPTPALELGIGSSYTRFNYKELCTPSDQEGAIYNSTVGNLKIHFPDYLTYFEAEYETGSVNSNYSGAILSTGQSVLATDQLKFTDYSAKLNFALGENVFAYTGYGHHNWLRVLNKAYAETYQWDVIPVGVLSWYLKSENVDMGVDVSLLPMLNSTIHVNTSDYQAGGVNSDASLGNKTGFKIKLPIVWHYGILSLETSPWFEHVEIGQSDPFVNTTLFTTAPFKGYEPSSETYIYGFEAMASVRF